jgi:hypothetical protein
VATSRPEHFRIDPGVPEFFLRGIFAELVVVMMLFVRTVGRAGPDVETSTTELPVAFSQALKTMLCPQ